MPKIQLLTKKLWA